MSTVIDLDDLVEHWTVLDDERTLVDLMPALPAGCRICIDAGAGSVAETALAPTDDE